MRIVCDEIYSITNRPGRHAIKKIAEKITSLYPKCFKDEIDGISVGTGFDSLMAQLEYRLDNMNRGMKRSSSSSADNSLGVNDAPESEGTITPKRGKHIDSYGCVNWQPNLPQDPDRLADLKFM